MECTTVDVSPRHNPTICADVRTLIFPKGSFDIIWASPPCQQFSVAKTRGGPRNLEAGDAVVEACLRIIEQVEPHCFIVENPQGYLRHRPYMARFQKHTVDYCMYGAPYRKRTDLFMSPNVLAGLRPLICNKLCANFDQNTGRHRQVCQNGRNARYPMRTPTIDERHSVPKLLCTAIGIIAAFAIFSAQGVVHGDGGGGEHEGQLVDVPDHNRDERAVVPDADGTGSGHPVSQDAANQPV